MDLPAREVGSPGPPIVLLHEALGSVGLWRELPKTLAARTGRRVIAYSRHGHGRSAPMTGPRGSDFLHVEATEVLPELLGVLEVKRPVLVGHSDGACIALIHAGTPALDNPHAIALLAPHVVVERMAFDGVEVAKRAYRNGPLAGRLARHHDRPDELFHAWAEPWATPEFENWSLLREIAEVRCPTLLVQGMDDEFGTLRQLDLIQKGLHPNVALRRIELPACGHHPHIEQREPVLAALVELVNQT